MMRTLGRKAATANRPRMRPVREADQWKGSGGTGRFPQLRPGAPLRLALAVALLLPSLRRRCSICLLGPTTAAVEERGVVRARGADGAACHRTGVGQAGREVREKPPVRGAGAADEEALELASDVDGLERRAGVRVRLRRLVADVGLPDDPAETLGRVVDALQAQPELAGQNGIRRAYDIAVHDGVRDLVRPVCALARPGLDALDLGGAERRRSRVGLRAVMRRDGDSGDDERDQACDDRPDCSSTHLLPPYALPILRRDFPRYLSASSVVPVSVL